MITLTIATTNLDKQSQARIAFAHSDIELSFIELETPEIQARTCEEVAIASARFAYNTLKKPVVVTDAGYFITSLNGFPGPFLKYVNSMLTPEDILRIMEGKVDRTMNLVETIAYIDSEETPVTFTSAIRGSVSEVIKGDGRLFDRLFIPDGFLRTAAELGDKKMLEIYAGSFTHWRALREHIEKR